MNIKTREIKLWDQLSDTEKKSGDWVRLEDAFGRGIAEPVEKPASIAERETFFEKKLREPAY